MSIKKKKTILIVEDDAVISATLRELLEESDYIVLTAFNGLEALKVLKSATETSLILLDLMMPVMDGYQFRESQLADVAIKNIPVVIMSADGHIIEKSVKVSAQEYIKKPLDIYNLLTVVERVTNIS